MIEESKRQILDSPVYKKFEKWHDTYLGVASLNLFILVAAVTLLTHILFIVPSQQEFKFGTIKDVLGGPGLAIVVVGLLGVAIVMKELGLPEQLYVSLYAPFALLCIGVSAWAILSPANEVDKVELKQIKDIESWSWRQIATVGVVILAFLTFVLMWINGSFRIDAIGPASVSAMTLTFVVGVFAYGLSFVFAMLVRTVEVTSPDSSDMERLLFYLVGVAVIVMMVVGSIKALDGLLSLFSGRVGHVAEEIPGTNASKAVVETTRAFRVAIYTVVILTAALMWRRRKAIDSTERVADLKTDWKKMVAAFVFVPFLAFLSELAVGHLSKFPRVFEFLRLAVLAIAVMFVGTSFIPWNFFTLGVAGLVFLFLILKLENPMHHRQRMLAVFVCAGLFVAGNYFFRGADQYQAVEMGEKGTWSQFLIWCFYLILPAIGLLLADLTHENLDPESDSFRHDLFRIYTAFVLLYTVGTFFFQDEGVPGIYSEILPQNEAASLALDGVLLSVVLLFVTGIWNVIIPPEKMMSESTPKTFAFLVMGGIASYTFISLRKDPQIRDFAASSQKVAEEWYIRVIKDLEA